MVSLDKLWLQFYNRNGGIISFDQLRPKTGIISRNQGVPRYAYSNATERYIPSSGIVSLEDFKNVKCQTGCVAVQTTDYADLPQKRVTDHPNVSLKVNGKYLDIILRGTLIAKVWAYWTRQWQGGGYYGYGGGYVYIFQYLQVQVRVAGRLYLLSNRYDFNSLGHNDNGTLTTGTFNFTSRLLTLVIVEDLNFNV